MYAGGTPERLLHVCRGYSREVITLNNLDNQFLMMRLVELFMCISASGSWPL